MGASVKANLRSRLVELLAEEGPQAPAAECLGLLCLHLTDEELSELLKADILGPVKGGDATLAHGQMLALARALVEEGERVLLLAGEADVLERVFVNMAGDNVMAPLPLRKIHVVSFLLTMLLCL